MLLMVTLSRANCCSTVNYTTSITFVRTGASQLTQCAGCLQAQTDRLLKPFWKKKLALSYKHGWHRLPSMARHSECWGGNMAFGERSSSNYISSNLYYWQQPSCLYSASYPPREIADWGPSSLAHFQGSKPGPAVRSHHALAEFDLSWTTSYPVHWLKCSTISLNVCSVLPSPPPFLSSPKNKRKSQREKSKDY